MRHLLIAAAVGYGLGVLGMVLWFVREAWRRRSPAVRGPEWSPGFGPSPALEWGILVVITLLWPLWALVLVVGALLPRYRMPFNDP